ncbi:FAD-dependent oxidoreductase [Algoriphagus zhangzhouensis]|uniref:FAD dependent oxidoreductase n=1 Tax=Algoriphagus zhangzhouensis TaxID=1073327 RepID=A0A1M7Z780_9BACT|nr:FAD-dependent oxidoreductase [Algoriphagus zhangzhouensis]TDY49342.1 FAD dependent oxidoreductase [Algoriphagus zhangzhouensis]SHO60798.1 FAD dependent oxidoreductase [Algoriphagus zhangzhouensis]
MKFKIVFFLALLIGQPLFSQEKFDLIIVGGGASGTSAGITSGRMGSKTLIIEPTTWLGGMLTSAGVSAIDGNHRLPSGIWGEFRDSLVAHYGSQQAMATGWVSNTLFEPHVGNEIFQSITQSIPSLTVSFQSEWKVAEYSEGLWNVAYLKDGKMIKVSAPILIDATELGDIAASLGLPYRLGMDARDEIGEEFAPEFSNDIIQDLTYVVTLQDYGKGVDKTIPKPANYDPAEFACACAHADPISDNDPTLDCGKMIDYGKLPNGKYMINWPNCGNDYYVNLVELSPEEREVELEKAKQASLRFVYYIQHELGYRNLGIAEDEYPSKDNLPMIPYHRESRRFHGLVDFTLPFVRTPYEAPSPLYRTGVVVGDYTIDHHHKKNLDAPAIDFIKIRVPSYNVPLGALIPENHPALILAEKSISVSNIVNGASRLQPVVLGIGQASGVLGAIASSKKLQLNQVSIRDVQEVLLNQNGYIMPFLDMNPANKHFQAMQKIGATGILKGEGVPYLWSNQTWFYPERLVTEYELVSGLKTYYSQFDGFWGASGDYLTLGKLEQFLKMVKPELTWEDLLKIADSEGLNIDFSADRKLSREEVSVLVDSILDPFSIPIDWDGSIK